jgi:hypothetical protein
MRKLHLRVGCGHKVVMTFDAEQRVLCGECDFCPRLRDSHIVTTRAVVGAGMNGVSALVEVLVAVDAVGGGHFYQTGVAFLRRKGAETDRDDRDYR